MNIKKLPISSLMMLLLISVVIGGYGSALYFWHDEKNPDVVIVEPSTKEKPPESKNPSVSMDASVRKTSSERFNLLNDIKLIEEQITNQESSIQFIDNPSANFIKERLVDTEVDTIDEPSVVTEEESSAEVIKTVSADYENALSNEFTDDTDTAESLFQSIPQETESFQEPISKSNFYVQGGLASQAELRLQSDVTYDGRYVRIAYPMGDVPSNIGVCTDVVIRSLRGLGIDLQQRVHEDMKRNFRSYPKNWQLTRPDSNIDHRRVPNLMTYFERKGASLGISSNPSDYQAGDIVAWEMGNGLTHIGIVSTYVSETSSNPLIVHNIGVGPEMTDILFDFKIIGHYKYGDNSPERFVSNTSE